MGPGLHVRWRRVWRSKRVALVGLGKSNLAVARYLIRKGAAITGFDQKTLRELGERGVEAQRMGLPLFLGPSYLDHLRGFDVIFLTPGIKKSLPQIREASASGARLAGEVDLFLDLCRGRVLGITGSAGKTTTVSLTGEMLRMDTSRPVFVGGNIGSPLIEIAEDIPPDAIVVLEMSSFQLQILHKSPEIGAVLNISANHLDVHDSMDDYVSSKMNIYRLGRPSNWAVLNYDNDVTRRMAQDASTICRVAMFSRTRRVDRGAYLEGDDIMFSDGQNAICCGSISSRLLPGQHNAENVLAACCVAMLAGARPEHVTAAIRSFRGVEHRQELVRVAGGVRYINDSIATAPDRTVAALDTIEGPIVLIAGGYDKGICFGELAKRIAERVKALVLIGKTSEVIRQEVLRALPHTERESPLTIDLAGSLEEAVEIASQLAAPGDAVLLSPACASFDMFRDFEERGTRFKEMVARL